MARVMEEQVAWLCEVVHAQASSASEVHGGDEKTTLKVLRVIERERVLRRDTRRIDREESTNGEGEVGAPARHYRLEQVLRGGLIWSGVARNQAGGSSPVRLTKGHMDQNRSGGQEQIGRAAPSRSVQEENGPYSTVRQSCECSRMNCTRAATTDTDHDCQSTSGARIVLIGGQTAAEPTKSAPKNESRVVERGYQPSASGQRWKNVTRPMAAIPLGALCAPATTPAQRAIERVEFGARAGAARLLLRHGVGRRGFAGHFGAGNRMGCRNCFAQPMAARRVIDDRAARRRKSLRRPAARPGHSTWNEAIPPGCERIVQASAARQLHPLRLARHALVALRLLDLKSRWFQPAAPVAAFAERQRSNLPCALIAASTVKLPRRFAVEEPPFRDSEFRSQRRLEELDRGALKAAALTVAAAHWPLGDDRESSEKAGPRFLPRSTRPQFLETPFSNWQRHSAATIQTTRGKRWTT